MCELYVYYKVAKADLPRLQRILSGWPEVRVMRQCDGNAEVQTWMEIHSGPFAGQTEAALARSLQALIIGRRHAECFAPVGVAEMQRSTSERAHHLHMPDAGFIERRAALHEAGTQVKAQGRELGVQQHLRIP